MCAANDLARIADTLDGLRRAVDGLQPDDYGKIDVEYALMQTYRLALKLQTLKATVQPPWPSGESATNEKPSWATDTNDRSTH